MRERAQPQDLILTDLKTKEDWEQAKLELILDKLASFTVKSYSLGWRWWSLFCRTRGINPLRQVTTANQRDEEELLLEFAVHLSRRGCKKAGAIKRYLSAVRAFLRASRLGNSFTRSSTEMGCHRNRIMAA